MESECRKKKAKTSGGDSKPSNCNKDKTCSYCYKRGASRRSASASTDGPLRRARTPRARARARAKARLHKG
eukprot:15444481-Alexandrium_andersonii.AAC.1